MDPMKSRPDSPNFDLNDTFPELSISPELYLEDDQPRFQRVVSQSRDASTGNRFNFMSRVSQEHNEFKGAPRRVSISLKNLSPKVVDRSPMVGSFKSISFVPDFSLNERAISPNDGVDEATSTLRSIPARMGAPLKSTANGRFLAPSISNSPIGGSPGFFADRNGSPEELVFQDFDTHRLGLRSSRSMNSMSSHSSARSPEVARMGSRSTVNCSVISSVSSHVMSMDDIECFSDDEVQDGAPERPVIRLSSNIELLDFTQLPEHYFTGVNSALLDVMRCPSRIKDLVLGYLDSKGHVFRLVRTNQAIPEDLSAHAHLEDELDIAKLHKSAGLNSMKDIYLEIDQVRNLLRCYPNITTLKLPVIVGTDNNEDLIRSISDHKKLIKLDLSELINISENELKLLGSLVNLQYLYFGNVEKFWDAGLCSLTENRKIRGLSFKKCQGMTDEGLTHIAKLENLEFLDLYCCDTITDDGLKALAECPRNDLADDGITPLLGSPIVHLDLYGCSNITNDGILVLQNLRHLKTLNISNCPLVTQDGINKLLKVCLGLENLVVRGDIDIDSLEARSNLNIEFDV